MKKDTIRNYHTGFNETKLRCPICGALNIAYDCYMDDPPSVGLCEHYYNCNKCGYMEEMAYSDTYSSFDKGWFCSDLKYMYHRLKNFKNFKKELTNKNFEKNLWRYT